MKRSPARPPIPRQRKHNNEPPARPEAGGRLGTPMTTMTTGLDHVNERPDWDCRVCQQPWPCARPRNELLTEFRGFPSVLRIYLSTQMYDALGDLPTHHSDTPTEFYERFLSWANIDR